MALRAVVSIRNDMQNSMLGKRSQAQKHAHTRIPFIQSSKTGKTDLLRSQNSSLASRDGGQWLGGRPGALFLDLDAGFVGAALCKKLNCALCICSCLWAYSKLTYSELFSAMCETVTVSSQDRFLVLAWWYSHHRHLLNCALQRRAVRRVTLTRGPRPHHCLQAKDLATRMLTSECGRAANSSA